MRLNKFIAQSGYCSRRKADELIAAGKVAIDGKVISELGLQIDPIKHKVTVEGYAIKAQSTKVVIAFYKPTGVLSSMSEEDGPSLLRYTEKMSPQRLFHVGRLDRESEGLLLLTNDGEYSHQISHPKFLIEKEYEIITVTEISDGKISELSKGVFLEDGLMKPIKIVRLGKRGVLITIHDGRNRILRRAFESLGLEVEMLRRIRIGNIRLGELKPGRWRHLSENESI
jgi:23S rRNA pseudouridine2605 synthase